MTRHSSEDPDDSSKEEPAAPGAGEQLRRAAGSLATAIRRAIAAANDPDIVVDTDATVGPLSDHPPEYRARDGDRGARTARVRPTETDRCRIDVRTENDTLVVIADVRDLDSADLSVRLGRRSDALVIAEDGTVVGRVDLPWPDATTERAQVKNGILTIRLRPGGA